jgi:hypothetical protein
MPIMSADEIKLISLALKPRSSFTKVKKNGMVRNMSGPHTPTMMAQIPPIGGGSRHEGAAPTSPVSVSFRITFFNEDSPRS